MNPGKYGVDPYDTEHAGSHDDNDCRDDSLSDSARSRDRAVHKDEKQYENAMILIRCMPASMTAASVANRDRN